MSPSLTLNSLDGVRSTASGRDDFSIGMSASGGYADTLVSDLWVDVGLSAQDPAGIISGFYDAATGGSAIAQARIAAGANQSGTVYVDRPTTAPGSYQVTATAANVTGVTSAVQTVAGAPTLLFGTNYGSNAVGRGMRSYVNDFYIGRRLNNQWLSGAEAVTVTLVSGAPDVCSVPITVTIPAGQHYAYFQVEGVGLGTTTISATAAGYQSEADLSLSVTTPALSFFGVPTAITVGNTTYY